MTAATRTDLFLTGWALTCALAAFTVHLARFRRVPDEGVIRWLLAVFFAGAGLDIVGMAGYLIRWDLTGAPAVRLLVFSLVLYGLFSYMYLVVVLGPYESSIRLRLLREIDAAHPGGIDEDCLLRRYNGRIILDIRLRRLLGSGQVVLREGRYVIARTPWIFFFLDGAAAVMRSLLGITIDDREGGDGREQSIQ